MNRRHRVKPVDTKTGRPKTKGPGILFKFQFEKESFLRAESNKEGKTMVRFIEDLLEFRKQFKSTEWPPKLATK